MSLWKRIFGRGELADPPVAPATPEPEVVESPPRDEDHEARERLRRLRRVGRPGGLEVAEALLLLRQHHGQAAQTPILDALIDAICDGADGESPMLDPIRVACATLLEERGDRRRALELVEISRTVAGMMLAAELHAQDGNLARAIGMIERVLARDIDTPGARERHERWCSQIGRRPREGLVSDGATVVAPAAATSTSFRILREVARGGAGTIYLAEDTVLGRRLAYKVYHRGDDQRRQIDREARLAVELAGPGVLRIFDASPDEGWIATEWIERGSLRDLLRAGRVGELFPLSGWFTALCRALERVHDEGLVHSDLKPGNVLMRGPKDPVLADFGICQRSGEAQIAGTPGYLAPERLEGALADPRDDVYALGRILEDVLAARDDAGADPSIEDDDRTFARIALACLAPAAHRPASAHRVRELLQ
jgi:eukaryotic-like serine/threonine-protein kinase